MGWNNLAVLDDQMRTNLSNWPAIRLAGFIILNAILGALIYILFIKAGIIGTSNGPSERFQDYGSRACVIP